MSTITETSTLSAVGGSTTESKSLPSPLTFPKPVGYNPDDPKTNLNVLPTFQDKYAERKWAKEQMVAIFRVFARHGFADGFNGHVSLRDPVEMNTFWISKFPNQSIS